MKRPYVICHMCTTIDGKIMGNRWRKLPGGKAAGELFEPTAASFGIPAWVVGTTTMKEFMGRQERLHEPATPVPAGDFVGNPKAASFAIGVDANGVLRFQNNDVDGDHVVLLITKRAGDAYRAHLRKAGVSYLVCGSKQINLPLALSKLHVTFGLRKLMLEGGGKFNGSMLRAGLVDEISQIVVPIVDGGGPEIAGFADTPGKPSVSAVASLKLINRKPLPAGAQWFRYRVKMHT